MKIIKDKQQNTLKIKKWKNRDAAIIQQDEELKRKIYIFWLLLELFGFYLSIADQYFRIFQSIFGGYN